MSANFMGSAVARRVCGANWVLCGTGFCVEWRIAGNAKFLFFKSFLLLLAKLSFWQGDISMGFRHFPNIS